MNKRLVITGIGVIASNGVGKDNFWSSLKEARSGIAPISLFDTSGLSSRLAGEVKDFNPDAILGPKGLRNLDRSTKLALAASKLALDDAGISYPLDEGQTDKFGVSLGSTMGSVWSISEFDKEALREGPRSVNPALFPNTVINSPASHISILFNIQGFNATLSTGYCASLDAIYYAMNLMDLYDYKVVLAGGVEELCEQTYKGFYKMGHLAGSRPGKDEIDCPFDKRRNGIVFGEGASIFTIEELEHAKGRGARIYGEILGYGSAFDPKTRIICDTKAKGASKAIAAAMDDSKIDKERIDYISTAANSTPDCDAMESAAINRIFGLRSRKIPASSIKSMIGECFSASGALNIAASLGVIGEGFIPPTINYEKPDRRCELDCVPNKSRRGRVDTVLVNSFSPTGSNSSLVMKRFKG